MPTFNKPALVNSTAFAKKQYLRSVVGKKVESYTCSAASVNTESFTDGTGTVYANQKILQSGEVIARITSGPESGKFGPFQLGVTDGRQTAANIVGINDTFAPWQLLTGDLEIGVTYICTAVQAWCTIRDASGARIALTDVVADAMRGTKGLDITFK